MDLSVSQKPPKRLPNFGRRPDPDDNFGVPPPSRKDAIKQCERIKAKIQGASKQTWDRSFTFLEDIDTKVGEIADRIKSSGVTPNQKKALDGWERGIDKCVGKDKPAPADDDESD